VISADGNLDLFDTVESLCDAAPDLPGWKIQRFRGPEPDYATHTLDFHGHRIEASSLEYILFPREEGLVDIALFMHECTEPDLMPFLHIAFLFIDLALGEYDVECFVGELHVFPMDRETPPEIERRPFGNFVEQFRQVIASGHGA